MKKILLSMLAITMAAFTFTSCEDVPEPYQIPGGNGGNNGGTVEGVYLDQDFSTSLGDFNQAGTNENISWIIDFKSACITGYKDFDGDGTKENQPGVTYLVSPAVDLTNATEAYITINHALNFEKGDINANNTVLISKDYSGDVNNATWEALSYNTDGLNSNFNFVTKNIAIPAAYIGSNVHIALRHTCNDKQSSTWEVKSLSVKEGTFEETPEPGTGESSKENPFTVAQAIANNSGTAWVKGYIVGWVNGKTLADGATFNANAEVNTNLLIADNANETDLSKCLPVQLPTGNVRDALNLQSHPDNYKKEVILNGSLEKYFGAAGLKSVSDFVLDGQSGGDTEEPAPGTPEGEGTQANPFNAAAANEYISKLPADTPSDNDIYIKGKVSSIKENFGAQFGNATYYISDDGTTNSAQFYVFRSLYLNNEKYKTGDLLNVGDDVIVCGKVVNFKGNTPETQTNLSYLYSWTKNGGSTGSEDQPSSDAGTKEKPYTVAQAIANNSGKAWVKGYIVGWIDGKTLATGATFDGNAKVTTNLLIADNENETDLSKCLPVQLPAGDVRTALNLQDNPGNYKKQVSLSGSLEKYFGAAGLKSVSEFAF